MSAGTPAQEHRARVVVIGDALIDELRSPTGMREFVGGAALNVAVGLSLLGEDVILLAMVGDDEPGRRIREYLDGHRVRLIASPSPSGTSRAVSDRADGGEPRYEFNDAARARRISFDAEARAALDAADLVVVSCFPFDDIEQTAELRAAVDRARDRLVIDANPRAGMMHDRGEFLRGFERMAGEALLVKVGDEDADLLLGAPLSEFVSRIRRGGPGEATGGIGGRNPAVLATAGRDGARLHDDGIEVHAGIVELPGPVIDTMGAGDATLSAVVHRIAVDGVPRTDVAWSAALGDAMAIAAATVRHEGALLRRPREGSAAAS
ncbi:fructokinase [Agromyces terreus]|uniref:Fructokinase n=1 Tax=Agromyces terreus TaxID=424795 RepID=A0A9X2H0E2_9MICO|nr:PfkB family carbohydrate kinase [Agromyces terreus]MCP2370248.1 fructokinase [Agromyces terreus]